MGTRWLWLVCSLLVLAQVEPASAHRIRPALVTLSIEADGRYVLVLALDTEAVLSGIAEQHADTRDAPDASGYQRLRSLSPAALEAQVEAAAPRLAAAAAIRFDGVLATHTLTAVTIPSVGEETAERVGAIELRGHAPSGARVVEWVPAPLLGPTAFRVTRIDGTVSTTQWLAVGERGEPVVLTAAVPASRLDVARRYAALGFVHIVPEGLDHILFVLGIFLLSMRWRPLLAQVTAFTVAHSITLALALNDVVSVPATVVEPLIALSIVYIAVENILTRELKPWRPAVVFAFGLLHGLGFAGVLRELGMPSEQWVTALVAFNVGVELGQLAVIGLAFLAVGAWFGRARWYRARVVVPASVAISAVGLWWTIQRVI